MRLPLRRPSTWVKLILGALLVTGLFGLVRGIALSRYQPETSDAYTWGAFHVHSTLSDGLASLEEIADAARAARVGFVMLSEHGAPHPEAAVVSSTIEGVHFIGGSEVGIPEGHLIASALEFVPRYTLPPYPPDAIADIRAWGGLAVVTYPEDPVNQWRYWEADLVPDGFEVMNVTSFFRSSSLVDKLGWAFFSLFNRYYYLSSFEPPVYALSRWDELLERGPVFGLYAANAHGGFPLTDALTVPVPSYATAFAFAGLGIDPSYRGRPEEAIRRGAFFSIVRAAGEPQRFEVERDGEELRILVETRALTPRVVLKRGGERVATTGAAESVHALSAPGVYRVEVYLDDHPLLSPEVPWILSNPIVVDYDFPVRASDELTCSSTYPAPLRELALESDDASGGTITFDIAGRLELSYQLSKATPEKVDRWVALALRRPLDLSRYRGVVVEGEAAGEPMRYWLELRAGERGYYASFLLKPGGSSRVTIPWSRFYRADAGTGSGSESGSTREPPPLSELDALFVSVNTTSSVTGFSAAVSLSALGWCE